MVCALAAIGAVAAVVLAPGAARAAAPATAAAPAAGAAHAPTVVTFTWGGGLADQMGALPVFRRYRMHATFYVPSGLVCQPSVSPGCTRFPYLTLSEVRQIAADHNEIGGLSVEHIPLTGLPAAEAQREICDDRVNLTRWGFRVTDFAYPFALVNHTLQAPRAALRLQLRAGYRAAARRRAVPALSLGRDHPAAEPVCAAHPDRGRVGRHELDAGHVREDCHRRSAATAAAGLSSPSTTSARAPARWG